jgi:hypothetical protein
LNPVGKDEWDLIEVKSTTSLKDVHIPDVAFQVWVFTEAGIKIRRCFLCHINNEFVRDGEINPKEFFTLSEVTAEVSAITPEIKRQMSEMGKVIRASEEPHKKGRKHTSQSDYDFQSAHLIFGRLNEF